MQKLKTLFLLLALLATFSFGAAWTGANSEPENTKKIGGKTFYVITTADELAWIAAQVNAGNDVINAVLANDIVFGSDTSTVNTANAWTPIGMDSTHTFKGVLDGAGYSIYGVYTEKTLTYGGLVGVLAKEGIIRNVKMKKDSVNALYYVGGLAAYNYGMVSGCTNGGSVSSTVSTYYYLGGIVGWNAGTVIGCINSGTVYATSTSISGGIVGRNTGTVIGCTNSGIVSSTVITSSFVYSGSSGGIAGHNTGSVSGCTNGGSVFTTTSNSYYYSGGIVGYNQGSVSVCVNGGSISSTVTSTSYYTGGIVGYNKGSVSGCTNGGDVSTSNNSSIGGIAGYNTGSSALVENSYSVATSLGSRGTRGGVAGENKSSAKIINCYYDSDILSGYSAVGSNSATATNVSGKTTADMKKDQFAWILNSTNGTAANSKTWSRDDGYPIFANATHLPIYKVVFNDDGAASNRYTNYRGLVTFPADPEPAEGYMFSGWYNAENVKVKTSTVFSADQTVNAVYVEASNIYFSIRFFNADSSLLDSQSVQYGKTPAYAGTPTLPKTAEFTYAFAGWHVEPTAATEDFDYYATYTKTTNSYTVTFLDFDGSELQKSSYLYGATPGYAKTPIRASTVAYDYTFAGWNPAVVKVVADAEYKAIYDSSLVKYTVTFMNGSDVFATQQVAYGASATAPNPAPTRDGYKFIGWTPGFAKIVGDLSVSALFEELILRTVFIYGGSGEILDTAKVEKDEKYVLPEAPEKKGYEFVGWYDDNDKFLGNPGDTITVTDDLKILAKYEEIKLSSSSANSSSSAVQSSSSGELASSSSAEPNSSSSSENPNAVRFGAQPHFGLQIQNRTVRVQNARVGENFAVLDMQGRVLRRGIVSSSELSFDVQNAGAYIVRVGKQAERVRVK